MTDLPKGVTHTLKSQDLLATDDAPLGSDFSTLDSAVLEIYDGPSCGLTNAQELVALQRQMAELAVGGIDAELLELIQAMRVQCTYELRELIQAKYVYI